MTNLAYKQELSRNNAAYPNFEQNAKQTALRRYRRILAEQHRYGFMLTMVCIIVTVLSLLCSAQPLDVTGIVLLLPLGLYLLFTKKVIFYADAR